MSSSRNSLTERSICGGDWTCHQLEHELGLDLTDQQIHDLAFKCSFNDTRTIGVFKQLNMRDMEEIYLMAR